MELSSEENKEPMNIEKAEEKLEAMMINEKQEMVVLRSVIDNQKYKVRADVASQIPLIRSRLKKLKHKNKKRPVFDVSDGVTKESLELVFRYLCDLLFPSVEKFDFEAEFLQLQPFSILNLIQAAYTLRLKNLTDLTCKRLADKAMADKCTIENYRKRKIYKCWTSDMSPSGPQHSDKDCNTNMSPSGSHYSGKGCIRDEKAISRYRKADYFINESYFLDVLLSPMVTSEMFHIGHWIARLCAVVLILSRAHFDICAEVMKEKVFPLLGKLVSVHTGRLFYAAVSALTRLVYMYPGLVKFIVDDNAFQAVCKAFGNPLPDKYCLSKFLTAVCRGYRVSSDDLPSNKFIVTEDEDIYVFACYTLLHLSYGWSVTPVTETWNKIIKRLIDLIRNECLRGLHSTSLEYGSKKVMIISSALGVIGNFIKWGSLQEIESLITEPKLDLLNSLRRVLSFESKKFQMEGSRIISNLAARRTILGEIVLSGVVGCLCELLENESSEVQWEAAQAVISGIYGCGKHRNVEQCLEIEQAR
ncbi:uncharacterized protein LOC141696666 isoform X2 [Apium graveolens]|uniref:uncharacterized protein LOC141696666 isoform X2 n=1 Tax=Apium graveolens TaxID=4045 RepID=UPI003D795895